MNTSCRWKSTIPNLWGRSRATPWLAVRRSIPSCRNHVDRSRRSYAQPANLNIPNAKVAFKPPPPPSKPDAPTTVEDSHGPGEAEDATGPFDDYLGKIAQTLNSPEATTVPQLYAQYHEKGGRMCNYVVPYEESPSAERRADAHRDPSDEAGDGLVMVVHALFKQGGKLDKICACSGFVVDTHHRGKNEGQVIVTCAHTLEEMYRNIQRVKDGEQRSSLSFVIPSYGNPRRVQQILSSMPRSDTIAMQVTSNNSDSNTPELRSLPISPFPIHHGMNVLTHLFGASNVPEITRSQSRLPPSTSTPTSTSTNSHPNTTDLETPTRWLNDQAWRRWGVGVMLGYRSYTNIEVEAGIHSSLPHILTSILPTPGSSGGPIIHAETGSVVGMISGRRMDNRVEGERGWGASSESIFEMFSLPGFMPAGAGD